MKPSQTSPLKPITHNLKPTPASLRLYNTASRSIKDFKPITPVQVGLYTCGPTVYDYAHIGNLRTYIFEDILKRTLLYNGFEVKHVMNVTDVGHLTSDADEGEDKMEKGARKQGKTVWDIAAFYQQQFFSDLTQLNILAPDIIAKATDEIEAQIQLIQQLFNVHAAYKTDQAIYFDVSTFPDYWQFSGQKLDTKQVGAREEVNTDKHKRNPADFALWLFTVGEHADHIMHWPSPWGEGFPGWHIECSAISMKYLGEEFDIHTGGVDHIGTHHPNEIAQSKAATGKKFAHFWLHGEFLNISGNKMSKSKENFYRLQTILDHGFTPLDYRYFCLSAHYRTVLDFDWDRLQVAATTLKNLKREFSRWDNADTSLEYRDASLETASTRNSQLTTHNSISVQSFEQSFRAAINNDLDMPTALSIVWEMTNSDLPSSTKRALMNKFDQVLGLGLSSQQKPQLTNEEKSLLDQRQTARANKDWPQSDQLRDQLAALGVEVEDTPQGQNWTKIES